jgi:hypothetical protein
LVPCRCGGVFGVNASLNATTHTTSRSTTKDSQKLCMVAVNPFHGDCNTTIAANQRGWILTWAKMNLTLLIVTRMTPAESRSGHVIDIVSPQWRKLHRLLVSIVSFSFE